ncbi:hypothetical protein S40285_02077 [Stachybotrys chlorohalonatus IBT 40285]|uniref:Zn(2)-C6 fungal-type domain-containing protein n=1 Tax=Stachybotrys chlorohalonatus (strain IBT 40285) TaxID=1283841 RepID=A0A084R1D3_STAC4|nr:hypothetical protein S40285_02077 [Stachybotrys chlorohalonata IBT 40285]
MASMASRVPSPHGSSPFEFETTDDESWQYVDYSSGASAPGSVGFIPSPASGSLNGFTIIGHVPTSSPAGHSPVPLGDPEQQLFLPSTSAYAAQPELFTPDAFTTRSETSFPGDGAFLTPQGFLFPHQDATGFTQQELNGMGSFMNNFQTDLFPSINQTDRSQQVDLTMQSFQTDPNVAPWSPANLQTVQSDIISFEDFIPSPANGSHVSSSPKSPAVSSEANNSVKSPPTMRRVKTGKVEKNKSDQSGNFVIVTPTSIKAHAGKPNPFECFEAMRTTQRGRKGPLANATKESALQVRRLGACFCCHSRKVKCDKERPCKHCKKLMVQVPQVVCWQFQDFLTILFPEFIRGHLRKDEMSKFLKDNVEGFMLDGLEKTCNVELFSGARFSATLSLEAKFFTAKTCDVLQHWHVSPGKDRVNLYANGSAPIGLDFSTNGQRDDLRKRTKAYVQDIVGEPDFAEQLTDSFRSTQLPKKILRIVRKYAEQTDSTMVKRALSIYTMHYIMSRHLCLTRSTIMALQPSGLVPQNVPWVTPRVLARQVKSLIDEMIMRETQQLFEQFSKSLKPKARREWAPCLASFLVLCLYMEAVEMTADNFVISQNEVNRRSSFAPEYQRKFALNVCQEVENMPFKQFAYQFHNIYQTHVKDANTKSFNPMFDDSFAEQGEIDGPAVEMVESLREMYYGEDWQDLQFLADDALLLGRDERSFPTDTSYLYTGRLIAKFLLSFMNESAIFGSQI